MYFNKYFNLKKWDGDKKYIIFDDFCWDNFKAWYKQFFGGQKEFEMTDKYCAKKTLYWGKPCIYIVNTLDFGNDFDYVWYKENTIEVYIKNKLY